MEEEIIWSKHYLEKLFSSIQDAIFLLKPDMTITTCNESAERLFNYSKQALIGKRFIMLFANKTDGQEITEKVLGSQITKGVYIQETEMQKNDGVKFPVELHISLMKYNKNEDIEIIATIKDITEKKQLQAQLIKANKMIGLGQLAGGVAHEINNPLTAVLGNAQLLLTEISPDNSWYREVEKIEQSAQRCRNIVTNLLGFSRQQERMSQSGDINETIDNTLTLYGRQLGIENIKVTKKYNANLPKLSLSIPQIQQVFLNLIVNAQQAMPHGGELTISTRLCNSHSNKNHQITGTIDKHSKKYIEIIFEDTGEGIERENLSRIFDPFFSTKEGKKNTGLGLSVSYGIIKKHNGYIYAESKGEKRGSKFTIILPI